MSDTITTPSEGDHAERPSNLPIHGSLKISGDTVHEATAKLSNEEHRQLIRWFYAHSQLEHFTLKQSASALKLDTTTLYRVFRGQYAASLENICDRISEYKKRTLEGQSILHGNFVETSTSRKIWKACEWALMSQSIVFVYGESQIGKTLALLEWAKRNNHGQTKYVRMPASAGVQLMMKVVADACFVSSNSCFEKLRERVLNSIDGSNILIVDELHQAFLSYLKGSSIKCLEVLREIHDRTRCGMVLVGTKVLRDELQIGRQKEMLQQFRRRGVLELQLPSVAPRKDWVAVAQGYGLDEPEGEADELAKLIIRDSGLGKFTKFLQAASRLSSKQNQRVRWEHFVRAHDILAKLSHGGES